MSVLWTAAEAAVATAGRVSGDWSATGVSIDTRSLMPGDLFVALKDQRDGHEFVAQALQKGAAAALVSHRPEDVPADAPLLVVDDVLEGLRGLAQAARARMSGKVIAVTGSVGKTSTKEMLATALAHQGRVHAAEKSYNNHWGVPLTLARMPRDTDFAVIEIGMNHPGEIAPLSRLTRPHVGIITMVAEVHLAAFRNVIGIAREKASLLDGVEPGGTAILNRDIRTYPILDRKAARFGLSRVRFGMAGRPEFALKRVSLGMDSTSVGVRVRGSRILFKIGAPGRHFAMNALAVLAAVEAVGADPTMAALSLADWQPPDGRGARWAIALGGAPDDTLTLIDESYNANPAAMGAALEVLAATAPQDGIGRRTRGRRIAFLTDMLELGPQEAALHAGLAQHEAMAKIDLVHCAGPLMQALHTALPAGKRGTWLGDSRQLARRARRLVDAGDVVMVKGSLGSKAGLIVDELKKLGVAMEMRATAGFGEGSD